MFRLSEHEADRVVALSPRHIAIGLALVLLPTVLPTKFALACGGAGLGFALLGLGVYGAALRKWRFDPGLWMLATFLVLWLTPCYGYFGFLYLRAILAPGPAGQLKRLDWVEIRSLAELALMFAVLWKQVRFAYSVMVYNWSVTRRIKRARKRDAGCIAGPRPRFPRSDNVLLLRQASGPAVRKPRGKPIGAERCASHQFGESRMNDGRPVDYPLIYARSQRKKEALEDRRAYYRALSAHAGDPNLSDVDIRIAELCRRYAGAAPQERAELRQAVRNQDSLLHFAHRMAVRALRTGDINLVREALYALSLEDARDDFRDTLAGLGMMRHVTIKLGGDFASLCEEAAAISAPKMAERLRGFLSRPPEKASLAAFGYVETRDAVGPTIKFGIW